MPREILERIVSQRANWWRGYKIWITIHWTFSAVATVSAALAAAVPKYAQIFGVVAAGASALIGVGYPSRRAAGFSKAYRRLNHACICFESDETVTIQDLLRVHDDGEKIIEASED